jgi:hypothetical protein
MYICTCTAFALLCEQQTLQGTRVERVITELFEGHTFNFIECVGVDYKSSRRESFMDLQLDVKGCPNIYDSFDRCGVRVARDAFVLQPSTRGQWVTPFW